jgi:hypothetical protein
MAFDERRNILMVAGVGNPKKSNAPPSLTFIDISSGNVIGKIELPGRTRWALKLLENYKGKMYTSTLTPVELALLSVRRKIPVEGMIASVLSIAEPKDAGKQNALAATHLIDYEETGALDSFHASLCGEEIISSDNIHEKLGVKRIGSNYLQNHFKKESE